MPPLRNWQRMLADGAPPDRLVAVLAAILFAAFAARLGARLVFGEAYFWKNSYIFLYAEALRVAHGGGFCMAAACPRPPLYLSFLALTALAGKHYLLIVVPQALMGTGTVLCAFLIGRLIFNTGTGLIACAIAAFYPYYVVHDGVLQDTSMYTFCAALAVWLTLRASRQDRSGDWLLAGLALAAVALTRTSIAPAIGAALLWTLVWGRALLGERLRATGILALTLMIGVLPWLAYTYRPCRRADAEHGYRLSLMAVANNPSTVLALSGRQHRPQRRCGAPHLARAGAAELRRLAADHAAREQLVLCARAFDFMRANPAWVARAALRKLQAAFSWRMSPRHDGWGQAVYALGYLPVAVLGLIGMFVARRKAETALIALLFLGFMAVTAVFFAHTSHRSYLDVYWMVFAASVLQRLAARHLPLRITSK